MHTHTAAVLLSGPYPEHVLLLLPLLAFVGVVAFIVKSGQSNREAPGNDGGEDEQKHG